MQATVAFPVYCNKATTTCYGTFDTNPNQRNLGIGFVLYIGLLPITVF